MSRRPSPPAPPAQLPLDLPVVSSIGEEDFLVGPSNEAAYEFISLWPEWPDRLALVIGPEASGKSHLAHIWASRAGASILSAQTLGTVSPTWLASAPSLVLDDCDSGPLDEARLFHLINLVRGHQSSLLLTARQRPDLWGVTTPDLLSRLRLAPVVEISPPDDALLRALLVKQFVDRQLIVDVSLVEFLLPRIERSFAGVGRIVAALDREALALGRRVTRAIATRVLDRQHTD